MKYFTRDIDICMRCPRLAWSNTLQRWYCPRLGMNVELIEPWEQVQPGCPLPNKVEPKQEESK